MIDSVHMTISRDSLAILAVDPVHRMLDRYEQRLGTMEKDRSQAFGTIS